MVIDNGSTICSDVVRIDLQASIRTNSTFVFSAQNNYPDAFKDNGDGTYDYFMEFYNGGCCLSECLEYELEKL